MIDLNSDMGEGFGAWRMGDDMALLDIVSSANIACGYHAGDPRIMARTVAGAAQRGVTVGAHVSYPDRVGFGRRAMSLTAEELTTDVLYQIGALEAFARAAGTRVAYVKPHGALYNRTAVSEEEARAVVEALRQYGGLALLALPGSVAQQAAQAADVPVVLEAFADRAYGDDAKLVPRREPGSVIHEQGRVVERAVHMATQGLVTTRSGKDIAVAPRTLCLHGDTPGAVELARAVRDGLQQAGVEIKAFA